MSDQTPLEAAAAALNAAQVAASQAARAYRDSMEALNAAVNDGRPAALIARRNDTATRALDALTVANTAYEEALARHAQLQGGQA